MPQYVELPNGDLVELRKGQRPEDAYLAAMQLFPDAFQEKAAPPPETPKAQGSYLGDLGRSFASGAVGATGALTSVFGADNAASRYLAETGESLQKGLSTSRQAELQAQAARMKKAEESGSTWEEVKAGLLNVLEAPIQTTASALGSFAPMVATLPLAKIGLGARAIMAVRGAIGGAQGAGAVKQNVYEAVLQAELEDKKPPEEAQAAAARAQSYVGENLDQILLGGGLGVVAGRTGAERLIPGGVRAQAGAAQQALAKRIGERGATGLTAAAGEFPLEGLQGGQERLAANLALQRTGRDVDTFTGVAGQATQEALAGGLGGAALGVTLPDRSMSIAARKAEEERLAQEAKADADYKASDEYALDIASKYEQATQQLQSLQEQKRKIVKNSPTVDEDREHNTNISNQIRALRQEVGYDDLKAQYQSVVPRLNSIEASRFTEAERNAPTADKLYMQSPQETIPGLDAVEERETEAEIAIPERLMEQRQYMDRLLTDNQERMSAAAANADVNAIKTLQQQRNLIKAETASLDEQLKASGFVDTVGQTQQLQQDIAKAQQQLQKLAGPGFDPDKASKIIERIEKAQVQLAELGGDQQGLDLGAPRKLSDPVAEADRFDTERTKRDLEERQRLIGQQRVTPEGQPDMFAESMDEVETQRREGETNFDYLDDIFEKAFNQEKPGVAPPKGVAFSEKSQGLLDRLDELDARIAAAQNTQERLGLQEQRAAMAADVDSDSSVTAVYNARNQAEEALLDLEDVLDDFRTGTFFGGDKKNVGAASTNREGLNRRAEEAKQAYIRAVLQEAAAMRTIRGEPAITTDDALKAADQINTELEELIVRGQAQRGEARGTVIDNRPKEVQEVRNARKAMQRAAERVEETRKQMRTAAQARDEQQQSRLEKQLAERVLAFERAKNKYEGMPKRLTEGSTRISTGDVRPLEERPFGKYRAALGTIMDSVEQIRRDLARPASMKPRASKPLITTQFAETEAKRVAEARGEKATTLGGELRRRAEFVRNKMSRLKDLPPAARDALNKVADVLDSGKPTRDLLDATEVVVDSALRGQTPLERDIRAIDDALAAMTDTPAEQQDLFTDPEERAQRKKVEGVVFPTAERFENSPIIKYARAAVDRARVAQEAFRKTLQKFKDDRRQEAESKEDKRQLDRLKKENRLRNQIKEQREDYAAEIERAQNEVRDSMQAAKMALAEPKLKAAQAAIEKAQKDLVYQQQRMGLYADEVQSPDGQRVMRRIKKAQKELAAAQTQLDVLIVEATSPVDESLVQEQAAHDDNVQFERAVLDKLVEQANKLQAANNTRVVRDERGQDLLTEQERIARAAEAQRALVARVEAAQRAAAEKASKLRTEFKERLARGLDLPSFNTADLPSRSALRARIDAIENSIGQPSAEVIALQARLEAQTAEPKDRNRTRRIRYTKNALELAQEKYEAQQEELRDTLRELKVKLGSHQTLTAQQRAEEKADKEALRLRTVSFDAVAALGVDRTKRATGPAAREQSAAPSQLRTGSAESIAGESRDRVDSRITESRQPPVSKKAVSAEDLATANRVSQATPIKNRAAGASAAQASTVRAAEENITRVRKAIEDKRDELRFASRENPVGRKELFDIRAELESLESNLTTELSRLESVKSQYAADMLRKKTPKQKADEARAAAKVAKELQKELDKYSSDDGELYFSRGTPTKGLSADALRKELDRVVGDDSRYGGKVVVFESVADFLEKNPDYVGRIPLDAKGFVDPSKGRVTLSRDKYGSKVTTESVGRAVLFADNIAKGEGLGILLHEVGVHIGFRNFFNKQQFTDIANTVRGWADVPASTLEGKIGRAAKKRAEDAGTPESQMDDELIAYAVEEAVKAGVEPAGTKGGSAAANWLRTIIDAFNKAIEALGLAPEKLKVGDLVNMAYGAAQLEIKGTWHGSDATFTAFDRKFSGKGEGAFDARFTGSESLGSGIYVTPNKAYAEYYQKAVPFGKAANASGYGNQSYQDYREMDSLFLEKDTDDLTQKELQSRSESMLLTAYLQGVSRGDALDPTKNKGAVEKLERLQKAAKSEKAKKAVSTLSLQKIKGLTEYPAQGNLYRTLDAIPREKVFAVNSTVKYGARPNVDALLEKYGNTWDVQLAQTDGKYALNGLFYKMRRDLGITKTLDLLKKAGFEAVERNTEGGSYVERAYIDQAPEILGFNLEPIGPADDLLFSRKQKDDKQGLLERTAALMSGVIPNNDAQYNANVPESMRRSFGGSDQRSKTFNEKLSTWALGLRVKTLDAWGAREALVQMGLSGKKLTETDAMQTRIYMRLNSEVNRFVHQALLNGPLKLAKDEKGYFGVDVDDKKPSVMKVLQTLRGAVPDIGNMKAVEEQFYKYMQIKRIEGDKRGYEVLNMRNPPTVREIREQKEFIAKNPKVKDAFEQAEKEFREYNAGMLDFAHAAGVFTNAEWNYFKSGNYVPFYRQTDNGNIEMLVGNTRRTIGNVIQQPQLKDLVGGEKDFLGFTESVMQNAQLLTRMSMQNLQARDVGYMVQSLGMGTIVEGEGPANSIRFKQAGKSFWVKLDANLFPKDIPAELLLQGLHGIKASVPTALKIAGIPTQILRTSIVRMPLYMIRQMIRDPLHAWMVTGLNFTPIVSSIKEMTKIRRGLSPTEMKLMRSGAVSSNVMTGDFNDASRTLRDLANQGGMSWSSAMQSLDNFALQGDTATRAVLYDKYREQGMSHFEAALGAAEVMNFSRRGTSTSLYMISTLIPFFNAQLQGLDSVWRTGVTGNTVFQDKLQVRQKLYQRAALMMGATLAYAVAMQDDEAYKNATPEERAMNWFIPVPGLEAAIRVPIPFEVGAVAKAIPELIFNAAFNDAESKDTLKGLRHVLGMSIPGDIPTIAKPIIESMANYSFFTKAPIESQRELGTIPAERYRPNTTELAKLMGQVGVSPLQVEHLVRGYTGSLGVLAMSLANPVLRPFNSDTAGEKAERLITETPFFGAAFQPNNGRGIVASVYADVEDWQQAAGTFKRLVTDGRQAEARAFADKYAREIALSSTGGSFQQAMGELAAMRRAINSNPDFSAAEKRERLNEIDLYQRKLAEQVKEVARMAK